MTIAFYQRRSFKTNPFLSLSSLPHSPVINLLMKCHFSKRLAPASAALFNTFVKWISLSLALHKHFYVSVLHGWTIMCWVSSLITFSVLYSANFMPQKWILNQYCVYLYGPFVPLYGEIWPKKTKKKTLGNVTELKWISCWESLKSLNFLKKNESCQSDLLYE